MNPKALHIIYKALRGMRTFQSLGGFGVVVEVTEEGEEMDLKSQDYSFLKPMERKWIWEGHDWKSKGETLTGYEPSEAIEKFRNNIEQCNVNNVAGNLPQKMSNRSIAQTPADNERLRKAETILETILVTQEITEEMQV